MIHISYRENCYVPNVSDKYITAKPYESYEGMQSKLNIEGKVRMIQKYYRAYRIAKFIKESAAIYRQIVADCKRHDEERILAYKYNPLNRAIISSCENFSQ